jgi:DNA-binding GntR family transcriptional regulator
VAGEPKYRLIAEDLRARIESGELTPGTALPDEMHLHDQYAASRNTIRDAIRFLERQGLVERRPGQGTFVMEKTDLFATRLYLGTVAYDQTEDPVFIDEVSAAGREPRLSRLRVEVQNGSPRGEAELWLGESGRIITRQQQRFVDDTPWALKTTTYPFELVERGATRLLEVEDVREGELRYLTDTIGVRQAGWRDIIAVRQLDAAEAEFFALTADAAVPVFDVRRTSYDENGTPFRLARMVYPADRHAFVLSPTADGLGITEPQGGPGPSAERADRARGTLLAQADRAERDAHEALARRSFDEAAAFLRDAVRLDPSRAERLSPDLDYLSAQPGESPGRLAWRRGLWLALAVNSPLELTPTRPGYTAATTHAAAAPAAPAAPAAVAAPAAPGFGHRPAAAQRPQRAGADLETAFIKLLRRFFALPAQDEANILKRLRRQSSGTQYGHDVQFDCVTTADRLVRCHVECKNYARELKPAHISEKIMETQAHWERKQIDYFLIVTPRAGLSNDLDHYIQTLNAQGVLPFQIQVWGPEEGIEEFFAIEPAAYRKVYGAEPPPVDTEAVAARWSARLKPVVRVPPALHDYLTSPRLHSLVGEDHDHFDPLFRECVEVDAVNATGSPLGPLRDVVSGWLDDPVQRRLLLLGEFGDGKSFACYRLTRSLARAYLDNPVATPFPLRLALRDLVAAGNPQELLSRRLQALGADMRDWARVRDIGQTLVILDGFDEMSAQLDHATVAGNLRLLADCARYFEGSKLLVTSRTHFFESTRMQERFLEQLGQPEVVRLAPLQLSNRIGYLHAYAEREGLTGKFEQIRRLYDPIGLAAKPLFLQLIKETLEWLPDDHFDEIILYETSVRNSLERKSEMLEDEGMHTLRREAIDGMLELLESVAVELLKNGGQPVDLRAFGAGRLDIARVLWKMSEADAGLVQNQDARARLGMRSLLKPFPDQGGSAWPVAFCHRSMSEYFVAQALVRAIRDSASMADELLSTVILRPEIVDFAGRLINKADDGAVLTEALARSAHSAVKGGTPGYLGGNAITLAYRSRHRPDSSRWAGLNLSYADLSGADLADADFSGSLLCYATLDNIDLTGADLTGCDLTGARIEETAPVSGVAPGRREGSVLACYGDGIVREWELGGSRPVPRKLLDGVGDLRSAAWGPHGDLIVIDGPVLSLWTVTANRAERSAAFQVRGGVEHVRFAGGAVSFARTDENQRIAVSADCAGATIAAGLPLANPGPVAFAADQTAALAGGRNHVAVVSPDMPEPVPVTVSADPTALDVRRDDAGVARLVVGDGDGGVSVLRLPVNGDQPTAAAATLRPHSGPVLCAAFLSARLVATGGTDRNLIVYEWDEGQFRTLYELKLTLSCAGVKTTGIQGDWERLAIEALRDKAEKLAGGSDA